MTAPAPSPDSSSIWASVVAALANRSRGFHLSAGLVVGAIVAVLVVFHVLNRNPALEAWLAGAKAEVASHAAWVDRTAKLARAAASARAAAGRLAADSATLRARTDSALDVARRLASRLDDALRDSVQRTILVVGQACSDERRSCKARGDSLARADSLDRQRADTAERRATIADSIVKTGIKVHEKRCGWTVIAGGGGGLVAGASGSGVGTGLAVGFFGGWGCRP